MDEQRLIDANALREDWLENGENEYVYDTNSFLSSLDDAPTIDHETLPIVRQLREENEKLKQAFRDTFACDLMDKLDKAEKKLARVTAERDSAVKDIEQAITIYRDVEGWDILCRFCKGKSCRSGGDCKPEWRGTRKEK